MYPCHPVRVPSGGSVRLFKLVAGGVRRGDLHRLTLSPFTRYYILIVAGGGGVSSGRRPVVRCWCLTTPVGEAVPPGVNKSRNSLTLCAYNVLCRSLVCWSNRLSVFSGHPPGRRPVVCTFGTHGGSVCCPAAVRWLVVKTRRHRRTTPQRGRTPPTAPLPRYMRLTVPAGV